MFSQNRTKLGMRMKRVESIAVSDLNANRSCTLFAPGLALTSGFELLHRLQKKKKPTFNCQNEQPT